MSRTSVKIAMIDAGPANILITVLTLMHIRKRSTLPWGAGSLPVGSAHGNNIIEVPERQGAIWQRAPNQGLSYENSPPRSQM
jgi:hypothetical protein